MITFDGNRSLKRKTKAEKLMGIIKDIDVPAKAIIHEGFTIKVWHQDDLSGGRITAPMGAVILLSNSSGIKIASCDYWAGACSSYSDLYCLYKYTVSAITIKDYTAEELEYFGIQAILARPDVLGAYYDNPSGPSSLVQDYSCTPTVMPYKGSEACYVTVTDMRFVDLNDNGVPDFPYDCCDISLTPYNSTNSGLSGRRSFLLANSTESTWRSCLNLPNNEQVSFIGTYFDRTDSSSTDFISARHTYELVDPISFETSLQIDTIYLEDVVPASSSMPSVLRGYMLDTDISIARPLGSFAFRNVTGDLVFIQAVYFDDQLIPIGGVDHTISNWFSSNPTEVGWRMFISVTIGSTVTAISSDQFSSLLDSLSVSSLPILTRTSRVLLILMAWPNQPSVLLNYAWEPHDSVMFFSATDAYSWTRASGTVRFDSTGIHLVTLVVPDEVTDNDGTRPDISYAGDGLYFCACNKVKEEILAVYIGSPFLTWTALPNPTETLMHVRPVKVTVDDVFLIGVVRETLEDLTEVYRFASLAWNPIDGGTWSKLAVLPFTVAVDDNFAVGLFGNNPLVNDLLTYPAPPSANPQNIVVPYDGYASRQP